MSRTRWVAAIASAVLATTVVMTAAPAMAAPPDFAPLDRPGPALTVPVAQLQGALTCSPGVANAAVTPVLLNPPTSASGEQAFSWNWEPALNKLGIPWCAYTPPDHTLGDIPTSGQYLVHAIRTMYAMAGRKIDILGWSQGGMSMRWALRFWPDTRGMVDDVVGFAAPNHGGQPGPGSYLCSLGCAAVQWQEEIGSAFNQALNSGVETFAGLSYTNIYTHTDENVKPSTGPGNCTSCLTTGDGQITNVATQDLCPSDFFEHILISVDPVNYALVVDALTHDGPADVARTLAGTPGLCSQLLMPGVDLTNPLTVLLVLPFVEAAPYFVGALAGPLAGPLTGTPMYLSEPPLPCYVYASGQCPGSGSLLTKVGSLLGAKKR